MEATVNISQITYTLHFTRLGYDPPASAAAAEAARAGGARDIHPHLQDEAVDRSVNQPGYTPVEAAKRRQSSGPVRAGYEHRRGSGPVRAAPMRSGARRLRAPPEQRPGARGAYHTSTVKPDEIPYWKVN